MAAGNGKLTYDNPKPFAPPTLFFKEDESAQGVGGFFFPVPLIGIPRETYHYSAQVIEEIMVKIVQEFNIRGVTPPTFKKYKAGNDDFDTFSPNENGVNIAEIPVKYFPNIVNDIQNAITTLLSQSRYPDDIGSLMARVFGQNTMTHNGTATYWNGSNRIRDGYIVPATNSDGTETLNLLSSIVGTSGSFPLVLGTEHLVNPLPRMGVDFLGNRFVRNAPGSIESSASDFPASVLTKRNNDGQLEGIAAGVPMTAETTPSFSRTNANDTSAGDGAGEVDLDGGYSFLTHHPFAIEQLRYQPPIIERFDGPEVITPAHYTTNQTSNVTINLPFVLSNPKEKTWKMNWGKWLVRGVASSSTGGLSLTNSPAQFNGFIPTNCPFNLFFPEPQTTCSCNARNTSYAIWGSSFEPLLWENIFIIQGADPGAGVKFVGPKTRLRFKANYSAGGGGGPGSSAFWGLYVRVTTQGTVNGQGFASIYVEGNPWNSLITENNILTAQAGVDSFGDAWVQTHSDGSISIPIDEALKVAYPQKTTGDAITAMAIFLEEKVGGSIVCEAEEDASGRFIPDSCVASLTCTLGTQSLSTEYIMFYEPPLTGEEDPRLP